MPTPRPWTQQSLTYAIETSIEPGGSSTDHDLPAVALSADRVPRAGRTARLAGELVVVRVLGVAFVGGIRHVVREERVVEEEERTGPELLARVAVLVGQGRPVVAARGSRFDEQEVPALLGVAVDLEGQASHRRPAPVRRPRQPLVRRPELGDLREEQLVTGDRRNRRGSDHQVRIDGIPEREPVGLVGVHLELADAHREEVRDHRLDRVPRPRCWSRRYPAGSRARRSRWPRDPAAR